MVNWKEHITSNPAILSGKPIVRNTRIAVDLILEKLGSGDSPEDLLDSYPGLQHDDIVACLLFASESIKSEVIYSQAS